MRLWYAPHMELPSGVVLKGATLVAIRPSKLSPNIEFLISNEPVEEEVDIVGGDDPPLPSYPPAEIENGGTNKISEHNSSNSSSEFGSSSSDLCYCILLMCFPTKGYVVCTLIFIACIQNLFVILISCRW
ncbi:hypothetical protein JHK87_004255 [Glycine soja]|nr:hypothetical protein JHK87_004255 [Glycine soja]